MQAHLKQVGLYNPVSPDPKVKYLWAGGDKEGDMYKRVSPEVELKIQFGSKGIFMVRGILRTIGKTEKGDLWFSLLVAKKIQNKNNGIPMKGFHYIEQTFFLDQVVEGKEKLLPYFEELK